MMQTKKRKRILAHQSKNQQNPGLLLFYLFTSNIRLHNLHHHFPNTRQYNFHLCPHIRRDHWRRHRRMACQCFLQDKTNSFDEIFGHFWSFLVIFPQDVAQRWEVTYNLQLRYRMRCPFQFVTMKQQTVHSSFVVLKMSFHRFSDR